MSEIIRRAIKSGPTPEIREWRSLPESELTRAERVMRFGEQYLCIPEGAHAGKPLRFYPFQEAFFYAVFDNEYKTRNAILSLARKNGKSAAVACILLAYLVGPEAKLNTQIASGAMSRDQASLIFNLACKMIQMSPDLQDIIHIVPSGKRLVGKLMNTEYRALAADGKTAQGLSLYLAMIDECGQIRGPRSDFVDSMITSQGAHEDPMTIYISTQSATDADFLSILIDDAIQSEDKRTVCHLYEADKSADLMDEAEWKFANPGLGDFRSYSDLKESLERASRMPSAQSSARNLLLNQRVSIVSPFISRSIWEQCAADPEHLEGMKYYGGLDLSARTDLTSFVLIGVTPNHISAWAYFWTPKEGLRDRAHNDRQPYDVWVEQGHLRTTPGKTVDYGFVAREIAEICQDIDLEKLAFDRWRIDIFEKDCEREGVELPLVKFGQGFKDMAPAIDDIEGYFLNASIAHGMHPVLTMCAANAITIKDPAGNRKLDKSKSTGRIDGMVALCMAVGSINAEDLDNGPSVYETRGVVSL